jgi:polar amino acid transport system permease protein
VAYRLDFSWLGGSLGAIANGVATTVGLTVATAIFGIVLSILGAAARRSRHAWLRSVVAAYVELIRNTPFIVQLFFIFFGLPSIGVRLNAMAAAVLAMTINLTAYGIEIVRAGMGAVSAGQREAARALGFRPVPLFVLVVLPQAIRAIFPALASQIVITMLESAVVSQIAVRDLTYEADLIQSRTFRPFETYAVITLIYLVLSIVLRRALRTGSLRLLGAGAG